MNTYEIKFKRKFTFKKPRINGLLDRLTRIASILIIGIKSINITDSSCNIVVECNKNILESYIDFICDEFEDEIKRVEIVEK